MSPKGMLDDLHLGHSHGCSAEELLASVRSVKHLELEGEIALVTGSLVERIAAESSEQVFIPDWGTFFRRGAGWHGPGGYYGNGTPMALRCEEISAHNKAQS